MLDYHTNKNLFSRILIISSFVYSLQNIVGLRIDQCISLLATELPFLLATKNNFEDVKHVYIETCGMYEGIFRKAVPCNATVTQVANPSPSCVT